MDVEAQSPVLPGQTIEISSLTWWNNGSLATVNFATAHYHGTGAQYNLVPLGSPAKIPHKGFYIWSIKAPVEDGGYFVHIIATAGGVTAQGLAAFTVNSKLGPSGTLMVTVDGPTGPVAAGSTFQVAVLTWWGNGTLAPATITIGHFHGVEAKYSTVQLGQPASSPHTGLYIWNVQAPTDPGTYFIHIGASLHGVTQLALTSVTVGSSGGAAGIAGAGQAINYTAIGIAVIAIIIAAAALARKGSAKPSS